MGSLRLSGFCLLSIMLVASCQKNAMDAKLNEPQTSASNSTSQTNTILSYGDTIFFLKNQPGNYVVPPVTKPNAAGYFKAIPWGLSLDSASGNINVTQSETGLRYKIYYVAPNGTLLDSVKIVISGVDYQDAIYEIASTPNAYDTSFPIYNARPGLALPCPNDDDDVAESETCVFDETDLDADGNDDIPGVIQDKLLIDIKKGTIDVEASYHAGVFGSVPPANGATRDFTFYYRLADASNRALNKLTVRLYHFKKRSDIPQSLLDTLNLRNSISIAVNKRSANSTGGNVVNQANTTNQFVSLGYGLEYASKPKRPPIIIIVSE